MATRRQLPTDLKRFNRFPSRENCDLDNPYEMFLWMFVALPFVTGGPLITSIDYYQLVSKRLHDLGAMLACENCGHTKPASLKYRPPRDTDPNVWTSPGSWVPADEPDPDPRRPVEIAADSLSPAQQAELLAELQRRSGQQNNEDTDG